MSSYQRLYDRLATESLDLITEDVRRFRDTVTAQAAALPRDVRVKFTALEGTVPFLGTYYDTLLPTLRRISQRSSKKSLRETLAYTYEMTADEAQLFTDTFRNNRTDRLMRQFIEAASLSSSERHIALQLLNGRSAAEQTDLIERYMAFTTYQATAARGHVSFVDATATRRAQRQARKRVAREQTTYGDSLKQHRENVTYRMTQLSAIYDGLLEEIIQHDLDPAMLATLAETYMRRTKTLRKPSAKLALLAKLVTPLTEKIVDQQASQLDAISVSTAIMNICSRVTALSDIQRAHLERATDEFRTLAIDYARIRSQKKSVTGDKLLVI